MQQITPAPAAPFLALARGKHDSLDDGLCVMECVAYVAGESHSDAPACACPVVAALARAINDVTDDEGRDILARRILQIARSQNGTELTNARLNRLVDQLTRVYLPGVLRSAQLPEMATGLAALAPLDTRAAQENACEAVVRLLHSRCFQVPDQSEPRTKILRAVAFAIGPVLGALSLLLNGEPAQGVVERMGRALGGGDIRAMIALLDDLLLMGDADNGKDSLMVARLAELPAYQARQAA